MIIANQTKTMLKQLRYRTIGNGRLSRTLEATLLQADNKLFTSLLYYKLLPHCQGANTMRNFKFKWYLGLTF